MVFGQADLLLPALQKDRWHQLQTLDLSRQVGPRTPMAVYVEVGFVLMIVVFLIILNPIYYMYALRKLLLELQKREKI